MQTNVTFIRTGMGQGPGSTGGGDGFEMQLDGYVTVGSDQRTVRVVIQSDYHGALAALGLDTLDYADVATVEFS